jgi:methylglutaconyl-CoA hydratase
MRRADASELFLTGERFTPTRAVEVGLVNAAVPAAELDEAVDRYVSMVARGGPLALAAAKELVQKIPVMDRREAFQWAAARSTELFRSEEATAGIAAFRQRRDAPWIGSAQSRSG